MIQWLKCPRFSAHHCSETTVEVSYTELNMLTHGWHEVCMLEILVYITLYPPQAYQR